MSNETTTHSNSSVGLSGLLGVLFVGLKLTGHIDWSWWWVTLPFWCWVPFVVAVVGVYGVWLLTVGAIRKARRRHWTGGGR